MRWFWDLGAFPYWPGFGEIDCNFLLSGRALALQKADCSFPCGCCRYLSLSSTVPITVATFQAWLFTPHPLTALSLLLLYLSYGTKVFHLKTKLFAPHLTKQLGHGSGPCPVDISMYLYLTHRTHPMTSLDPTRHGPNLRPHLKSWTCYCIITESSSSSSLKPSLESVILILFLYSDLASVKSWDKFPRIYFYYFYPRVFLPTPFPWWAINI